MCLFFIFLIQNLTRDEHEDIMDEIASRNSKLALLEQARLIEVNGANKKKKKDIAVNIDDSSDRYIRDSSEKLQHERKETRKAVFDMNEDPSLQKISLVLTNYEGNIHFFLKIQINIYFSHFLLDTLDGMKYNMKSSHDLARFCAEKHKLNETLLRTVLKEIREIKADLRHQSFHSKMNRVDISYFFPLESDEKLEEFMDRTHVDWESRKNSFYDLLYNAVTDQRKRLACALLHLLFTRNFISQHKWPMSGG